MPFTHMALATDASSRNRTYPSVIAEPRLHEFLRFQGLELPAEFEVACVCLLERAEEGFPQNQVCVLDAPQVLTSGMHEAVTVTWEQRDVRSKVKPSARTDLQRFAEETGPAAIAGAEGLGFFIRDPPVTFHSVMTRGGKRHSGSRVAPTGQRSQRPWLPGQCCS